MTAWGVTGICFLLLILAAFTVENRYAENKVCNRECVSLSLL